MNKQGFTIVEMIVAIVILTTAILGMGASAGYMMQAANGAGVKAEALQAVEGRISLIVMDPRYEVLDSIYGGSESNLPGLDGFVRVTTIKQVLKAGAPGRKIDYKEITVSVSGPGLVDGIARTMIVGAP